jgi:transcriptional regulator with XRE-family HTH domain
MALDNDGFDREFAARFAQGMDRATGVPKKQHGRYTWLSRELKSRYGIKVSIETVRQWSRGQIKPREEKASALCKLFNVDYAWLIRGEGSISTSAARRVAGIRGTGAVHFVAGQMMLEGINAALPREEDALAQQAEVDLYAIVDGQQSTIKVVQLEEVGAGEFEIDLPEPLSVTNVAMVLPRPGASMIYLAAARELAGKGEVRNARRVMRFGVGRGDALTLGEDLKIMPSRDMRGL